MNNYHKQFNISTDNIQLSFTTIGKKYLVEISTNGREKMNIRRRFWMVEQEQYAEKVDKQQAGFLNIVENLNNIAAEITKDKEQALQYIDFLKVVINANEVSHNRWG